MITGTPVLVAEKKRETTGRKWRTVDIFVTLTEKASILVFSLTPQQNPSEERSVFYALLSEATWISENTEILPLTFLRKIPEFVVVEEQNSLSLRLPL